MTIFSNIQSKTDCGSAVCNPGDVYYWQKYDYGSFEDCVSDLTSQGAPNAAGDCCQCHFP